MSVDALSRDVRGEYDLPNWTSVNEVLQAVSDTHVATVVVRLREAGGSREGSPSPCDRTYRTPQAPAFGRTTGM